MRNRVGAIAVGGVVGIHGGDGTMADEFMTHLARQDLSLRIVAHAAEPAAGSDDEPPTSAYVHLGRTSTSLGKTETVISTQEEDCRSMVHAAPTVRLSRTWSSTGLPEGGQETSSGRGRRCDSNRRRCE